MSRPHKSPKELLSRYLSIARSYAPFALVVFLVAIYGFLSWRIYGLTAAGPDPANVSAQLQTVGVPKVDKDVVAKMQQLEDNNVNVQTLFDQARQNPFSE